MGDTKRVARILFVCDFGSVHSRGFISYFAKDTERFRVQVLSTTAAPQMANVEVIPLLPRGPVSESARAGMFGRLAYVAAAAAPTAYARLRLHESVLAVRRNLPVVAALARELRPDIIHAFRTHPEGIIAWRLRQAVGPVPFYLTTWGQDLVLWARGNRLLMRWTRELMADVNLLLPDNARDGRLARSEFGLPEDTPVLVMPASGGLDLHELARVESDSAKLDLPGEPRLLSTRGYENIYLRTRVLFEAFAAFRRTHPNARLYVEGPEGHPGGVAHRRWMRRLGIADSAHQVHLTREGLLRHMAACELYVSSTVSDGLPISLLEALYFGQVPVVTRHESVVPPIREGRNGFTVPGQSPAAIAAAWERAVELTQHRERVKEENRSLLAAEYARDRNLEKVAGLYRQALG